MDVSPPNLRFLLSLPTTFAFPSKPSSTSMFESTTRARSFLCLGLRGPSDYKERAYGSTVTGAAFGKVERTKVEAMLLVVGTLNRPLKDSHVSNEGH